MTTSADAFRDDRSELSPAHPNSTFSPLVLQVLLLAVFFVLQFRIIDNHGIFIEEPSCVSDTFAILRGHAHNYFIDTRYIRWNSVFLITMAKPYEGALLNYLTWPLFALFGISFPSLRLVAILFQMLVAVAAARTAAYLGNSRTGTLTLFLILFHATLFQDANISLLGDIATMQLFVVLTALAFFRWLKAPSTGRAFVWAVMMGLGFYVHMKIVYQAVVYIPYFIHCVIRSREKPIRNQILAFVAGLLMSPYVWINLPSRGNEFLRGLYIWTHRFQQSGMLTYDYRGNFTPIDYFSSRLGLLLSSFTYGFDPLQKQEAWIVVLMIVPYVIVFQQMRRRNGDENWRKALRIWGAVSSVHAAFMLAPFMHPWDAILPMVPLGVITIGLTLDRVLPKTRNLLALLAVVWGGHLWFIWKYETRNYMADDMTMLTDYLLCQGIHSPVLLDANGNLEISVFTEDRVCPRHYTDLGVSPEVSIRSWLSDPSLYYVVRLPMTNTADKSFQPVILFFEISAQRHKSEFDVRVLNRPDGTPYAQVFRMKTIGKKKHHDRPPLIRSRLLTWPIPRDVSILLKQ